ncbi:hypothetical protein RFI_18059 [Reticulomyxa filosa]|uniref:Uncharacterized protein n=1 Tax=Reticulomyxa filosa TaxID=46433 RepID=X6MZT4_RETFI|nr:hypothetical protein RFI_18059 [Reticulomyxa filosa]|eukprot:ETO19163.1 hypothetical protein RFI_18059 [Reticulomyxa filosa]
MKFANFFLKQFRKMFHKRIVQRNRTQCSKRDTKTKERPKSICKTFRIGCGIDIHDPTIQKTPINNMDVDTNGNRRKALHSSSMQQTEEKNIDEVIFENVLKKRMRVQQQFLKELKSATTVIKFLGLDGLIEKENQDGK